MLRAAVAAKSEIGQLAESVMKSGGLVSDELVMRIVTERIAASDCSNGFILDGFPRTLEQARMLEAALSPESVDLVMAMDADEEVLTERICGRWIHKESGRSYHSTFSPPKAMRERLASAPPSPGAIAIDPSFMIDDETGQALIQRSDDTKEALRERLASYKSMTVPLLDHFSSRSNVSVVKLDCNAYPSKEEMKEEVCKVLDETLFGIKRSDSENVSHASSILPNSSFESADSIQLSARFSYKHS
jgi:adenylate kinase